MITTFFTHSIIDTYPPNIYQFPNFYNCKEHLYVLHPGDMLYIPPKWFHWVFSYNQNDQLNKAISFPILNDNIVNKTTNIDIISKKPFVYNINTKYIDLNRMNDAIIRIFKSKNHNIYPFNKNHKNQILNDELPYINIKNIIQDKKYNFVCGNYDVTHLIKPPDFLNYLLDKNTEQIQYKSLLWHSYSKDNNPVNTGLHFDNWHNFLLQIDGIKIVRLYHPNCHKNLYIHPHVKYS